MTSGPPGEFVVRVIAGPHEKFTPGRLTPEQFARIDDGVDLVPLPVDWLGADADRPSHEGLAGDIGDARVRVAARVITEDFTPPAVPFLVLPRLAGEVLDGADPVPGQLSMAELLRRLQDEVGPGDLHFDVRLLAIEHLDDTPTRREQLEADLDTLLSRLEASGLRSVSVEAERIAPADRTYWRAAMNGVSATGAETTDHAERIVAALTDVELGAALVDDDGRRLLELTSTDPARASIARTEIDRSSALTPNGMSVTFVCEKLADRSGGAERVLIELANALRQRGHDIEILSHENNDMPPFFPLADGVVHRNLVPASRPRALRSRALQKFRILLQKPYIMVFPLDRVAFNVRYRAFRKRLWTHIDMSRPDVVVPFMPPAIVATALAESTHRPRLVASMHNAPVQDFENPLRWDPGSYARSRRLELMDRMDTIAVLLPEYREWYPPHLRERTTVVPNAVAAIPQARLTGARRAPTILGVGRLAQTKRHDLSLRAFGRVVRDHPDWELKLFGDGPLADELTALRDHLGLAGRAHILGHTQTILDEYLSASILCHPAHFEGFPLAVTESLAAGLPVVGFADCSGLNALVVDGHNGVLVDPGDGSDQARVDALAAALSNLIEHDDIRLALGKAGPVSMEPYAPSSVSDAWERVLFPAEER